MPARPRKQPFGFQRRGGGQEPPPRTVVTSIDLERLTLRPSTMLRSLQFKDVDVVDLTLKLDEVSLSVIRSSFENCTFTQRSRRLHRDGFEPQGSFANAGPSVYRNCTFIGLRLRILGGFSVGFARFENCTFERCKFPGHFSHNADYLDCTFIGPIKGGVFCKVAPAAPGRKAKINTIVNNDFTRATFDGVSFRRGVDLGAQKLPANLADTHDLVVTTPGRIEKALLELPAQDGGRSWLRVMADEAHDGQRQLLIPKSKVSDDTIAGLGEP